MKYETFGSKLDTYSSLNQERSISILHENYNDYKRKMLSLISSLDRSDAELLFSEHVDPIIKRAKSIELEEYQEIYELLDSISKKIYNMEGSRSEVSTDHDRYFKFIKELILDFVVLHTKKA